MKIGFVGLGKMGKNMVLNLLESKHQIVAYNRSPEATEEVRRRGAIPSYTIKEVVNKLPKQKIVWLMVPAGKPVDSLIKELTKYLKKGDIIIDGGNSFYKNSIRRYNSLKKKGINFVDVGTSGGIEGARHGACMMIGGDKAVFKKIERLFRDMSVRDGYGYMGSSGAGHFVKMVHNAVEYGMMASISEGIQTIEKHKKSFGTDLKEVLKVYEHGSIVESRLISWLAKAWKEDSYLKEISGVVPKGNTEGEMEFLEKAANMPILRQARLMRVKTRKKPSLAGKMIAAMRNQFGGHAVNKVRMKK